MRSPLSPHTLRRTFTALAALTLLVAGSLGFVASAASAGAEPGPVAPLDLPVIDLHNATAQSGSDCPDDGAAYWHFVFAPNDGSAAFVSITLNLTSETVTFTGSQIIPNGSQTDNVFVAVPAGHALGDLQTSGSYAAYTGSTPNQFNLSHVCEGTVPTTETPTTETPTTETPTTETPTTETPTTETPTTPTSEVQPTVVTAEVLGTVQTPTEAVAAVSPETLPYTGADTTGMLVAGLAVLVGGLLLVGLARARRGAASER